MTFDEDEYLDLLRKATGVLSTKHFEASKGLLEHAVELAPGDWEWPIRLGELLELHAYRGGRKYDQALLQPALDVYRRALSNPGNVAWRLIMLARAAPLAFRLGQLELARRYAWELTETAGAGARGNVAGDALYVGHSVLGLVALAGGDADEAVGELLAAGKTPGSPVLGSFGPEFDLANALLAAGHSSPVIQFLQSCKAFWPRPELHQWIELIRAGDRPNLDRYAANAPEPG